MAPVLDHVDVEYQPSGAAIAVFSGEHDLVTKAEVRALLDSLVASHDLVVVDFSKARFIDGAIVRVLLDANRDATERGATFRVQLGTATIVHRVFEVCGVFDEVDHAETREEALAKARAM